MKLRQEVVHCESNYTISSTCNLARCISRCSNLIAQKKVLVAICLISNSFWQMILTKSYRLCVCDCNKLILTRRSPVASHVARPRLTISLTFARNSCAVIELNGAVITCQITPNLELIQQRALCVAINCLSCVVNESVTEGDFLALRSCDLLLCATCCECCHSHYCNKNLFHFSKILKS